jgi:hypothetical protein
MTRNITFLSLSFACAGGRNSTSAMKGISDQSQSDMPESAIRYLMR